MTISLITECREADIHKVQRIVNREISLLFEAHGIRIINLL